MSKKKRFKALCDRIFCTYLAWFIAFAGLPLTAYGLIFQTEMFRYVDVFYCFIAVFGGFVLGYSMMSYVKKQERVSSKSLHGMVTGYAVCFLFCWLCLYTATSVSFLMISAVAMSMCTSCMIIYLGMMRKEKQREKERLMKEEADRNAGKAVQ